MVIAVKTREFERSFDYDWEDYFPSDKGLQNEAAKLHRAFEGVYVDGRFAALLRPTIGGPMLLGVSTSTNRKDAPGSPIRTIAFFRASDDNDLSLLAAFFAECLRKPDAETLYNAESDIAQAVESLYQTKKPDEFLRFCRSSLPAVNGIGAKPTGRYGVPRDDANSRQAMAESLPALIRGGEPFLIALTDRLPSDVLASLGSMFDHATVRIFSKAVTAKERIPGGGPNTRAIAAAIGGAVILALLVAAGRSYRNDGGDGEADGGTNIVSSAIGGEGTSTNVPASSRNSATNALPPLGKSGESDGQTWRDRFQTSTVPEEVETDASAVKDGSLPSSPTDSPDKATDNRR